MAQTQQRQRHWQLRSGTGTHRHFCTLGMLIVACLLLSCPLSLVAMQQSIIRPPCSGQSFGNPLVEPAYYVMAGIPLNEPDPSIYRLEFGQHHPLGQRSFSSDTILAVRIPLNQPLDC
jgi:hypothetical protein